MLEEVSVEMTQDAQFPTVGRSSEQKENNRLPRSEKRRCIVVTGDSFDCLVLAHNPTPQILFPLLSVKPCLRDVQLLIQMATFSACSSPTPAGVQRSLLTVGSSTRRAKHITAATWRSRPLGRRRADGDRSQTQNLHLIIIMRNLPTRDLGCRLVRTSFRDCAALEMRYFKYLQCILERTFPDTSLLFGLEDAQGRLTYDLTARNNITLYVLESFSDLNRSSVRQTMGINSLMTAGYHYTLGNLGWRYMPSEKRLVTNRVAWMREKFSDSNPTPVPLGAGYYG